METKMRALTESDDYGCENCTPLQITICYSIYAKCSEFYVDLSHF